MSIVLRLSSCALKWQASQFDVGFVPRLGINGLYTRESLMWAHGCFWLLLGIPTGKPAHNRAIPLRQTNKQKKKKILLFWAELPSTLTKWLPPLPLPLLMIWLFPLPKLIRKLLLYAQELAIFCSSLPTFRKICDFNFLSIHIFLFLFNDLGPKSTADVFCYMYHLSEAILGIS